MATNPYTNKVIFGNQTVMDLTGDTVEPQNVLQGQTFHDRSGAPQTGTAIGGIPEEELRDTVGWTGKNLLVYPYRQTTKTENGITFTDNGDGTITVSGTATATATFVANYVNYIATDTTTEYILSGCPSGGSNSTYRVDVILENGGGVSWDGALDTGNGVKFSFPAVPTGSQTYLLRIRIGSGTTLNNAVFYPMLRKATITDSTYEPYHKSVDEVAHLTTDTAETDIQDGDYFPFYDTSATAKRKSLWSNIKAKLKAYFDTIYSTTDDKVTQTETSNSTNYEVLFSNTYSDSTTHTEGARKSDSLTYTPSTHELKVGGYIPAMRWAGGSANSGATYIDIKIPNTGGYGYYYSAFFPFSDPAVTYSSMALNYNSSDQNYYLRITFTKALTAYTDFRVGYVTELVAGFLES